MHTVPTMDADGSHFISLLSTQILYKNHFMAIFKKFFKTILKDVCKIYGFVPFLMQFFGGFVKNGHVF